jgi:hypothetical protein
VGVRVGHGWERAHLVGLPAAFSSSSNPNPNPDPEPNPEPNLTLTHLVGRARRLQLLLGLAHARHLVGVSVRVRG